MLKKFPYIILIALNIILLGYIYIQKGTKSYTFNATNSEDIGNLTVRMSLEDEPISPFIQVINSKLDTINLQNIFSSSPTLGLFYPSKSCKPCAEKIISLLNDGIKKYNLKNVIIITDFEEIRDLAVFSRMNKIKFPVYKIIGDEEDIKSLIKFIPYYAITDNYLMKNSIFIAPNDKPDVTKKYLEIVSYKINTYY